MGKKICKEYNKDTQLQVSTGIEQWANTQTGEVREFQTVEKRYYGQKHFWKMYMMDFLAVLGIVESKQLDVICYIMDNTSPYDNIFIGSFEKIAKKTGVSVGTVNIAISKLKKANFMTSVAQSTYRVNPSILVKGGEMKKRSLVIDYVEDKAEADAKNLPSGDDDE